MINQKDKELIERFVFEKVSDDELNEVNGRMNDFEFLEEMQMMREVQTQIISLGRFRIKMKLDKVFDQKRKIISPKIFSVLKYSIAASFLIAVCSSIFFTAKPEFKKNTFSSRSGGAALTSDVNRFAQN